MLQAQVDTLENGSYKVTLSDGLEVIVFAAERNDRGKLPCYYVPTNLQVSKKDTTPEFSYMTYGEGKIDGGLMHLLLKWGFDAAQMKELRSLLRNNLDSNAVLYGSLSTEQSDRMKHFKLSDSTALGKILNNSLTNHSQVPLNAGGKLALSWLFSAADAQAISRLLQRPEELEKETITLYLKCRVQNGEQTYYQEIALEKNLLELVFSALTFE